jgi:dienelactone hydrolase
MDRYCLPTVLKQKWLYFSFDCVGQGQMIGIGTKNDLRQFDDTAQFLHAIKSLPFVDKSRIGVVGMSMGAARAAVTAYPDPDIKVVVMLSGPYNFKLTMAKMTRFVRFLFWLGGNKFPKEDNLLEQYSGYNFFKRDGITLIGGSKPTPNSDRVFLAADEHDHTVNVANTYQAIEILGLSCENFHIFTRGDHCFEGNEYFLAVDLYEFLIHHL